DAVYRAVSEAATRPESFRRAVVLLSDGEDNISRRTSIDEVASHARALGIPVFAIGLLLDSDDSLRALAAKTDGAYFAVSNPGAIDSVFATIAELLFEKGCCNVWYRTPSSRRDGTWRGVDVVIAYPDDTTAISDEGYRAPEGTSSVVGELTRNGVRVSFDASRRSVSLISPAGVPIDRVQAFSSIGRSIVTENDVVGSGGRYSIDLSSAPGGPLFIVVTSGGVSEVFPILNLPQW
ncbi:VWA domain-containing protein, partial [uncultured Paraglaciecola sp.]|uniref:vWA domain-containing protein n=1 Tax=uncultured Paraglaciecola sp. TaxID=1765024 RepID=UPI0026140233